MRRIVAFLAALVLTLFAVPADADVNSDGRWMPGPQEPWQYFLAGTLDPDNSFQMTGGDGTQPTTYIIDGFENSAQTVAVLHARGYRVSCYIDVGAAESYRPDFYRYPSFVLGRKVSGWAGERWVDIRRLDVLGPILSDRFQMCKDKGFDAVDPDLMDGYTNRTGFPLTYGDQLTFNRWVADTVHSLGLSVSLKGDPEQAHDLVDWFDFAINEECAEYNECGSYEPFFAAGKTVLHVEYKALGAARICYPGMNSQRMRYDLDGWRRTVCY